MSGENTLTVSQVNKLIKDYLDNLPTLKNVHLRGEISNFVMHTASGHVYLTLKDEQSTLKAVMFGGRTKLSFLPKDGMKVLCRGRISTYIKDGTCQLYIDSMEQDGIGALYIAFEQLKEKLRKEGLFSPEHKKKIPKIPFSVGIVTAPTGAAVRDMIHVISRRFPAAKITIYPSLVQGEGAPAQIIKGLKYLDQSRMYDVIIIGRGGGSIEDLWAFNNEELARAIFDCHTPVISAVGHETDTTISDFVADLRAPTPSVAAELAVPDSLELMQKFDNVKAIITNNLMRQITELDNRLQLLAQRRVLQSPLTTFDERKMTLGRLEERLYGVLNFELIKSTIDRHQKLLALAPARFLEQSRSNLRLQREKLQSLNPLAILSRGYAVVYDSRGKAIASVEDVSARDTLDILLADGKVTATATQTTKNDNKTLK